MWGDASPYGGGQKHSFHKPTFAADSPPIGAAPSSSRMYPTVQHGRRSGRSTGRSGGTLTDRSQNTEPLSTFRSESSTYADDRASPQPGMFPPRAKSSFELLSDDLHAGGSFVPRPGMPGYADPARRYQTLQQTNGVTYMDEDGEDNLRQRRYRNKLEGRVAAEQRIAAAYEAQEAAKAEQQERSIRRKANMVAKYEETVAREEKARTKVMRKKALAHDGERLYSDGACIAGRKGTGHLGRQTCFPFTRFTTAEPMAGKQDDAWYKHTAGEREAKHHVGLRAGGGGGGGGIKVGFSVN